MIYRDIKDNIDKITHNITNDENRLNNIIDALTSGDLLIDINDKLLNNLSKISHIDPNTESAMDYVALIIANLESQKILSSKNVTEELVKILGHNIRTLESIKTLMCVVEEEFKEEPNKKVKINTNKETPDGSSLLPNNVFSNTIFYLIIFFILITTSMYIDKKLTETAIHTVTKTTRDIITPPDKEN